MSTYGNIIVLETLGENLHDSVFVLFLNDTGGGREHTVCGFPQARVRALACLEKNTEEFRPLFVYTSQVKSSELTVLISSKDSSNRIPLSVYCRATSASVSPIFLRTSVTVSLVREITNFSRMAIRCSLGRLEKISLLSPVAGSFRVFVAILRKSTAEKARVCQ